MSLYVKNANGYHLVLRDGEKMGPRGSHYTACGCNVIKGMPTVESLSAPPGTCEICTSPHAEAVRVDREKRK